MPFQVGMKHAFRRPNSKDDLYDSSEVAGLKTIAEGFGRLGLRDDTRYSNGSSSFVMRSHALER